MRTPLLGAQIQLFSSVFKRLALALSAFVLMRLLFFAFNRNLFEWVTPGDYARYFFQGLRFDLTGLGYANLLYLTVALLPIAALHRGRGRWIPFGVFLFFNAIAQLLNAIDVGYYQFTFKRSTRLLLNLVFDGDDVSTLLPRILSDFWYLLLIWIVVVGALAFGYWRIKSPELPETMPRRWRLAQAATLVCGLAILIVATRGGLQPKPIGVIVANGVAGSRNAPLLTNTPFVMVYTFDKQRVSRPHYMEEEEQERILDPVRNYVDATGEMQRLNVVVLILESFSKEYMGPPFGQEEVTPFLDRLAGQGRFYDAAYANGKSSIEGIPSIVAGIPSLMPDPFIISPYSSNRMESLASILRDEGYQTAFFHGGRTGTMYFDSFAEAAGFERYYGMEDYPGQAETDGKWGIQDGPWFDFFADELDRFDEPFFAGLFTLSSHHPYTLPAADEARFGDAKHPILKTVRYADACLERFFERGQKAPWYKRTLFVLVADHTGLPFSPEAHSPTGSYAVPIVYFQPGDPRLDGVSKRTTQQIDIMPTVLDYLHYPRDFFALGSSALRKDGGFAINYRDGEYQCIAGDYALRFEHGRARRLTELSTQRKWNAAELVAGDLPTITQELTSRCKAFIQVYDEALIDNRMTAEGWRNGPPVVAKSEAETP